MTIGLALSGGGMRSMVHVGMMQALEEEGITFDIVSGTSAGAVIGALYCAGNSPAEIVSIAENTSILKMIKPALNWRGLLRIDNAENEFRKYIPQEKFEDLQKPLIVCATDLGKGKIKYFKKGPLMGPTLASCSIPVMFDPVMIDGVAYIDGGVIDNLPVKPLKKKCDFIIGLHSNPISEMTELGNWKELMERSLMIAISTNTYNNIKNCDIFWEPEDASKYNVFDFKKAQEIFDCGYRYARKQLKEHPIDQLMLARS